MPTIIQRRRRGNHPPQLRPYQVHDLDRIRNAFNTEVRRILYQLPTGAGKTVMFCDLIREVAGAGERVVVLVHRDEILGQVAKTLRDLGVARGIIAPDVPMTSDPVQVASVFTLVRRLGWLERFDPVFIVADEAHHAAANTWNRILDTVPDADLLGATATPRRLDGKPLNDLFDKLIVGPTISELIDDDYLSPVQVFVPPHQPDLSRVHVRMGDYATNELSSVMSTGLVIGGAVKEYKRLCAGVPAIAFCVDIAHSKLVADRFSAAGYRAAHVDGETPRRERRELIADLERGRLDILSNCGLISEGLDVPGIEAAILLRPTRSLAMYLQMVGRALRPGKPLAYILDHAANVYKHGLPTAKRRWSLNGHQQDTSEGADLIRCPCCGAMNERGAEFCEHCGAQLTTTRAPRIEIEGDQLAEAIETPTDDAELKDMTYRSVLQWCADDDGRLQRERLERVAAVRAYKDGWVYLVEGRHWEKVLEESQDWRRQQGR